MPIDFKGLKFDTCCVIVHTTLRTFTVEHGQFWLEQNPAKNSKWAKPAREGHEMAWEFTKPSGAYTGRLLIPSSDTNLSLESVTWFASLPVGHLTNRPFSESGLKRRRVATAYFACDSIQPWAIERRSTRTSGVLMLVLMTKVDRRGLGLAYLWRSHGAELEGQQ